MELLYISFAGQCGGDRGCELRHAASNGDVEKLSELRQLPGFDVNAVDSYGRTALMAAAFGGETESVRRLLEDDEIIINKQSTRAYESITAGSTALDIARRRNKQAIVRLLEGEQLNNIHFFKKYVGQILLHLFQAFPVHA